LNILESELTRYIGKTRELAEGGKDDESWSPQQLDVWEIDSDNMLLDSMVTWEEDDEFDVNVVRETTK